MERRILGATGISVSEMALGAMMFGAGGHPDHDESVRVIQAGLTLPHLATAFVLTHPAVSAVLLGPRTMEQLNGSLAGAGTVLDRDLLDRIDAIVAPGTELNPLDNYYTNPDLAESRRRRR
jgi:aryl-alcohol dehydrogenase-like predicted oxidoreductase